MEILIYYFFKKITRGSLKTIQWTLIQYLEITRFFLQNLQCSMCKISRMFFPHFFSVSKLILVGEASLLESLTVNNCSVWMFWYDPFNNTGIIHYIEGDENQDFHSSPHLFCTFLTTPWFCLMSLRESELRFLVDKNAM